MHHLTLDLSDANDGPATLEFMASTNAERHAAVMAEVQQVLAWAWRHFPHTHGPVDDGMDWDHDLQVQAEDGGWHTVTLTITGRPGFVDECFAAFGDPEA